MLISIRKPENALPNIRQLFYNKADDWIVSLEVGSYLKINGSNPIMFNMGKERTVSKGFVDKQADRQAVLPKRSFPKAEERYKQN